MNNGSELSSAATDPVPQELLDELTRSFAATAADYDQRAVFPAENIEALHAAGLLGLTVAREFGGRGAGIGEAMRVLSAVARGEPSTALILFMTYAYFAGSFSRTDRWPLGLYAKLAREAATEISKIYSTGSTGLRWTASGYAPTSPSRASGRSWCALDNRRPASSRLGITSECAPRSATTWSSKTYSSRSITR